MTTQSGAFSADPNDPVPAPEGPRGSDDPRASDATDPGAEAEPNRPTAPSDMDELDPGEPHEPVGNDNIREGRVGGVMGGPRQQQGQGQGG